MTKSTGTGRGGYREGARRPKLPARVKREKQIVSFQAGDFAYFVAAMGSTEAAKKQIEHWVQAYPIARGESDRLFAQSPTLLKTIRWIESQPEPDEEILEELYSLLVTRSSDEVKIADDVTQVGNSLII